MKFRLWFFVLLLACATLLQFSFINDIYANDNEVIETSEDCDTAVYNELERRVHEFLGRNYRKYSWEALPSSQELSPNQIKHTFFVSTPNTTIIYRMIATQYEDSCEITNISTQY